MRHSPPLTPAAVQAADPPTPPSAPGLHVAREAGFSLIETLAAAALLGGVLIAVMTLFVHGGQKVNSGKMMTAAIAIAEDVQEHFRTISPESAYSLIEDAGDPSVDTVYCWDSRGPGDFPQGTDWPRGCGADGGTGYHEPTDDSYRRILGLVPANPPPLDGSGWKQLVAKNLPKGGSITITVRGLNSLGNPPATVNFREARLLQVTSTIRWRERKRDRSVVFETLKV
jgi:type II secretory pathway pseudopilin PulG